MKMNASDLAKTIDHTLLKPQATPDQIDRLCDEALQYGFFGVCVNPIYVKRTAMRLESAGQKCTTDHYPLVISVAGFPLGSDLSQTKADQAHRAVDSGATEIDMVIPLGMLIAGDYRAVRNDIEAVVRVVHRVSGGIVKVILETGALTDEQIISGCRCCAEAEADFVKTSTGFHECGGATIEHVRLMHRHASPMRVKAAGGIRSAAVAVEMIRAGACRIGTSSGVAMIESLRGEFS